MSVMYTQSDVESLLNKHNCKLVGKYIDTTKPFKIKNACGHISTIRYHGLLKRKTNICSKCSVLGMSDNLRFTIDYVRQFLKDEGCVLTSGYVNARTDIEFIATCGHKNSCTFSTFKGRKQGRLCKECSRIKHNNLKFMDKPTKLYYIKIHNMWKIGITTKPILDRFSKDIRKGATVDVIDYIQFSTGSKAYALEQRLLEMTSLYKYKGTPLLVGGGNSELRTKDVILNLNKYKDLK